MITQTIKQWLNRLFAWWPWKRSIVTDGPYTASDLNWSTTQEPIWRLTLDRTVPQPGITTIIVEQEREEILPEPGRSIMEERPEYSPLPSVQPLLPPVAEEEGSRETTTESDTESNLSTLSPTQEQQWAFLRYLVKQGIVNEGFSDGQVPEQYGC